MQRSGRLGSSVNGGELLFLALATSYCNACIVDAAKRGIELDSVEVQVTGEFGTEGVPARNIRYTASVALRTGIRDLGAHAPR
jgi:organic hydroperoxide reductase OsmC/OhrA